MAMRTTTLAAFSLVSACGGVDGKPLTLSTPLAGADGGVVTIGTPCELVEESDPSFTGSAVGEVSVESSSGQPSGAAVCIAYHFQGRASCPYGQPATGQTSGRPPCSTPDGQPVVGSVDAQCLDRRAAGVVVWSCRCANDRGGTSDGASYCSCPSGTACTQSVLALGSDPDDLSGAYCLPPTAFYDAAHACTAQCDPVSNPCD